ncbi:Glutelin type-A 3 [Platanthera guangdongensis]|uniref:Glutelin type-A 3 n=1 Tax=Platanthera guangdongensis TaxID=2320717 RepID=A0ABR2MB98_9ASPA
MLSGATVAARRDLYSLCTAGALLSGGASVFFSPGERVEAVVGGFCRVGGDWSYTGFVGEEYHHVVPNVRTIDGVTPLYILCRLSSHSQNSWPTGPQLPGIIPILRRAGPRSWSGPKKAAYTDQHQKIFDFHRGDIIAVPSGFVHWCYNNGDRSLVTLRDTNISTNQLDSTINISCWPKAAKTQKGETQGSSSSNHLLRAFNRKTSLTEVLGGTDFIYLLEFRD